MRLLVEEWSEWFKEKEADVIFGQKWLIWVHVKDVDSTPRYR